MKAFNWRFSYIVREWVHEDHVREHDNGQAGMVLEQEPRAYISMS